MLANLSVDTLPRWLRDFVPLILLMVLIFALSSRTGLIKIDNQFGEKLVFKGAHVIVYAALAWLWWRTLSAQRQVTWVLLFLAWFLTTLYGVSDEFHQTFVPGRHGKVSDVLFDASGALTMILLLRHLTWLRFFPERLPFIRVDQSEKITAQ